MAKEARGVPITIDELVSLTHLGCDYFAGQAGGGRQATWAHVCELEDPVPWLEGGELVMTTGMAIPEEADAQVSYLAKLTGTGAAGLAISRDLRAPELTAQLGDAADARRFPILLVSIEVPFIAIARIVITANQDAAHREMVRQLSVFDAMRAESHSDHAALFRRLEHVSGYDLYLSSPTGSPLLPGVRAIPDEYRELLARPTEAPAYVPGGYVVSVPIGQRVGGYLLGLRHHQAESGGLATLQHIATIAALRRVTLERERESARREGGERLAELLAGRHLDGLADRVPFRLRTGPVVLFIVQVSDVGGTSSLVHQWLSDAEWDHLLVAHHDLVLLTPVGAPVPAILQAVPGARAGRSREFRLGESIAVAERQARLALDRARDRGESFVDATTIAAELDWLPSDPALRRAMVDRVLGPILGLESSSKERLVETLRVWLQSGQRTGVAAQRLDIHPHTLTYRLRRIEELTGRDLSSPAVVVELWLALELHREETPA
jgi:purine catabolism regulator